MGALVSDLQIDEKIQKMPQVQVNDTRIALGQLAAYWCQLWRQKSLTGKMIGMKPAGGIKTAKQAIAYLCMVKEVLGPEWLNPNMFRFGASSLLNDVLKQIFKQMTGNYYYDKAFSLD